MKEYSVNQKYMYS